MQGGPVCIALIRRQSLGNPAYQTLAPPRRTLPLFPTPTSPEPHMRGGQSGGQENSGFLGDGGGPRETVIVGVWAHPGQGRAEAACQPGVSGKRGGSAGGERAGRGASVGRP